MDLLQTCAEVFERRLPYQYHIIAGRKGKMLEFTISFDRADFHHLAGLHKLTDNVRFLTGKRASIMQEVLAGRITLSHVRQSAFFRQMEPRLKPLAHLEEFLDSPRYTLLKKEKINLKTGETIVQYDCLTPKPKETEKRNTRSSGSPEGRL